MIFQINTIDVSYPRIPITCIAHPAENVTVKLKLAWWHPLPSGKHVQYGFVWPDNTPVYMGTMRVVTFHGDRHMDTKTRFRCCDTLTYTMVDHLEYYAN